MALSTFLELDKEWNSESMWERRKDVRRHDNSWNDSILEGVLEFFEKFAILARTKALKKNDVYDSTLMWYLARYFLFAREQMPIIREKWKEDEDVYSNIQALYKKYLKRVALGGAAKEISAWELKCKQTEQVFWEEERENPRQRTLLPPKI